MRGTGTAGSPVASGACAVAAAILSAQVGFVPQPGESRAACSGAGAGSSPCCSPRQAGQEGTVPFILKYCCLRAASVETYLSGRSVMVL